jgi:hypothetical protein
MVAELEKMLPEYYNHGWDERVFTKEIRRVGIAFVERICKLSRLAKAILQWSINEH